MLRFLAGRLAGAALVLVGVAALTFALVHFGAGDPAALLAGDRATVAEVAAIRTELGLDRPLAVQFGHWLAAALQGDLGRSRFVDRPVALLLAQRLPPTLALATLSLAWAVVLGVPLGALAARHPGGCVDRGVGFAAALGCAVPVFLTAYLLIWLVAVQAGWLPVQGWAPLADGARPFLAHLILPSLALGLPVAALIVGVTRVAVRDVLRFPAVRTALAQGRRPWTVLVTQALPLAAAPILAVAALGTAALLGGAVVTETVFNLPGLGRLAVDAVLARDLPTVQGVVLVAATVQVVVTLLLDLAQAALDPRLR